ncbi:unnamed protein product [Peronospora destructor]|uniref:protein-tyrosine-phosphatase n=1 Tax=Peronospora destructor TaxID=86335 RepID=A0AAV0TUI0_9STRA|nr:unnamed protein product [Peronospora destructor]
MEAARPVEFQLEEEEFQPIVTKFACKKCRCILFKSNELMPHKPEQHEISTRKKLKDFTHHIGGHVECSSYFLEETLPWMDEALLAEGKIHCPTTKCQSRLGGLQWSGSQCSCGTWVTPSIKMTKSRVDAIIKHNKLNIVTGVMLPKVSEAHAVERIETSRNTQVGK